MRFIMLFVERPKSLQAKPKSKQRYKERLQARAQLSMATQPFLEGELYVRIIWFHNEKIQGDIDNIVKPILDALRRVVYADDRQIVKCVAERVETTKDFVLSETPASADVYEELVALLGDERINHVLYIEVGSVTSRRIVFGPIDGEYL